MRSPLHPLLRQLVRPAVLTCLLLAGSVPAGAQHRHLLGRLGGSEQRPGARGGVESEQRWTLAVNFAAARSKTASGTNGNFWMTGIDGNMSFNLWHGLGVVADLSFLRAPAIAPHIDLNEYTYMGGLRYTLGTGSQSRAPRRLQIFAEGLGGRVQAFNGLFPAPGSGGPVKDASSIGFQAGAGIDYRVGRKIGFRVVQADFTQSYLPNGQLNLQRDIRLASGFSAHF